MTSPVGPNMNVKIIGIVSTIVSKQPIACILFPAFLNLSSITNSPCAYFYGYYTIKLLGVFFDEFYIALVIIFSYAFLCAFEPNPVPIYLPFFVYSL